MKFKIRRILKKFELFNNQRFFGANAILIAVLSIYILTEVV